ncbi:MAG TPA: hypothetical protein VNP94_08310 [Actinomycetota bacterium]|nr:hypothetical protein [Actinomycetota bacterium]
MRGRLIVSLLAVSSVVGAVAVLAAREERAPVAADAVRPTPRTEAVLPARTVDAGGVRVRIEPLAIDETGAAFLVTLDTHEGDLAVDLAASARLEVGGSVWDEASWEGDPPGGHHRRGTLVFGPEEAPTGRVRLTIDGLPEPVVVSWDLGG